MYKKGTFGPMDDDDDDYALCVCGSEKGRVFLTE